MLITANSVFSVVLGEQFSALSAAIRVILTIFSGWRRLEKLFIVRTQCVDYANIWKPVSACIQSFSTGMKLVDGNLARFDWVS